MTCIERTYLKNICFNIRAFLKKITTVTFLTISLIVISNTAYASFELEYYGPGPSNIGPRVSNHGPLVLGA